MIITSDIKTLEKFGNWYRNCVLTNYLMIQKPMEEMVKLYLSEPDYFKKKKKTHSNHLNNPAPKHGS